jgi:MinD-like ATPase involved in chromosome partitioning or flagellar assembly
VIDTSSWLDERTLRAFEHAESVIFVTTPEIAALKAVTAVVEYLSEAGTVAPKTMFVLNNTFGREILKVRDVEQAIGTKVGAELPYDPFLYLKAVNEGVPIVRGAPKSPAAERLVKLSGAAFGGDGIVVPPSADERKSSGRFKLRRR